MEKVVKDKRVKTPYLGTGKYSDGHIESYLGFIESNDYTTSCSHYRRTDEDFKHCPESATDIKMRDDFLTNLFQGTDDALYRPFSYCWGFEDDALIDPYYKNKNQRL